MDSAVWIEGPLRDGQLKTYASLSRHEQASVVNLLQVVKGNINLKKSVDVEGDRQRFKFNPEGQWESSGGR